MISSEHEYLKACQEVDDLNQWLAQLTDTEAKFKGLTSGSVRNMISRIQAELAEYEIARVSAPPASKNTNKNESIDRPPENSG
jgi:hypothetical protein